MEQQDIQDILLSHFDKELLYSYFSIDYNDLLYGNISKEDFTNITGITYEQLLDLIKDMPKNEEYATQALKDKNITEMKKKAYEELSGLFEKNNNPKSMIIKCKLFDKELHALIDTGATNSVLAETFIKDNNLEQYVDYHTEVTGLGVSSKFISTGMIWHTYLYSNGQCFPTCLHVQDMPSLGGKFKIDLIIGMDILALYDIKLVPKDRKLILNGVEIECLSY